MAVSPISKILLSGAAAAAGLTAIDYMLPADAFGSGKGQIDTGSSLTNTAINIKYGLFGGGEYFPGVKANSKLDALLHHASNASTGNPSTASMYGKAATAGFGIGATVAVGLTALLGKKAPGFVKNLFAAGGVGGTIGAYYSMKFVRGATAVAADLHQNIFGNKQMSQDMRAFSSGSGYRSWAKRPGGRMPVGHLGATGDLVFDMHKIRHKSVI